MMTRAPAIVLFAILFSLAAVVTTRAGAQTSTGFELVGRHDLGARGMNAGMAIAGDCGYVGSRSGNQGSLILDLADPASPTISGEIPHDPGSTMRELRAIDALDLLVVLNYRLDTGSASPNSLDLYDIADCDAPAFLSRVDFGDDMPHEFFLWTDPDRPDRVLAFVAMWGHAPNLRVVDLSDPADPTVVTTWDAATEVGIPSRIHSVTLTADGRRAYVADWDSGLMVLDMSRLARDLADPTPRLMTPPGQWLALPGRNVHSAVAVPGSRLVITTQEIYGPGTCPYGRLHLVDASEPAAPAVVGAFGIAENDPGQCGATAPRDGAFTTHNPLVAEQIAFVTWYAGGLRAVDISDPGSPREVGAFSSEPLPAVAADDFSLGSYPVRMWSSPIIRDGLIYVVDIRNGLFILRYTGPRAEAIANIAFAEGNAR